VRAAARDIKDPKTGKSIYQQWQDRSREQRPEAEQDTIVEARIGALGSGSDYTPFLQHVGVPSMDMGFGGDYGVYHSAYDSFYWMSQFGDPSFAYHVAAAQLWGTIAMRLANADGLPFNYTDYASQLREFFNEALKVAKRRNLENGIEKEDLNKTLNEFTEAAEKMLKVRDAEVKDSEKDSNAAAKLRRINDALIAAERDFIDSRGLRGRPWYRHQIYAPGFYTGYAAQPLTDFRQGLDERNGANAKEGLEKILAAIKRVTSTLKQVAD
jgi:N-acetylated-alpha-linked acidic dipeptidase